MTDLTVSVLRFSAALTLYSLEQLADRTLVGSHQPPF